MNHLIIPFTYPPKLFNRLNVQPLSSFKEMKEDIPLLALHFLKVYQREYKREGMSFSPDALQFLMHHTWQGNVSLAAKNSGMERQAFQRLLRRHGMTGQDYRH